MEAVRGMVRIFSGIAQSVPITNRLYKLPIGHYTMVVEWFPPEMNHVTLTPQATTISISNHTTKIFEKYTKTIIHFHRWDSSPPQFLYLDLHGTVSKPSSMSIGHLIVYGVKETVSNVDPSVYDTTFVIENGKMVMETDLSLNGHNLSGSVHYIHGYLNTNNGYAFLLNDLDKLFFLNDLQIMNITVFYLKRKNKYPLVKLKIKKHTQNFNDSTQLFSSNNATRTQKININSDLSFSYISIEMNTLFPSGEEFLLVMEYIVP